jgi:PAS domain S-box-containing protein
MLTPQSIALFNHASMGIIIVNGNSIIQSINPFALTLLGYKDEEVIGKPIEIFIPSRYHHNHVNHRNNYAHNLRNRPMGLGMDLFAVKKDGTEFPVEVSLGSYEIDGEKYVISFLSDISIRKKAEAEIKKLNDELEATVQQRTKTLRETLQQLEISQKDLTTALEKEKELNELKSRFVSMASHEFRTPLSTVLSSAYLIEKYTSAEDQSKRDKHVQRIVSSVTMLTDILNDFLSLGKIEEGKIQVRLSKFNIRDLFTSIIEEIKNILKKDQTINYVHEGDTIVYLDPSLLKHIVMNLISNASKFSPEGAGINVTTHVNERVIVSVKDNGIGISKEDQKHLMERFFRGANAGNIQGTGLGLHIVSKYAELMKGEVKYNTKLEKGSEFSVIFDTTAD